MKAAYFFFSFLWCVGNLYAQSDTLPSYAKYPLPQFSVALDSVGSKYTQKDLPKGKNIMLMLFSPDCEHCKRETEIITANMDKFRNTHILMLTSQPFEKINAFANQFKLANYRNITVTRDDRHFFPVYFRIKYFPFLAIYDRKKQFRKSFEGDTKLDTLLPYLK